jgi:putative ABC transport system permease protein
MNDLKFAIRQLLKNRGFTVVAVLTLALGIGVNTGFFSVMNTIMLHPLPYPEPDRLVRIFSTSPQSQSWPHSVANFFDHRAQNDVFEHMTPFTHWMFSLTQPGKPAESVRGIRAGADLFHALRVPPLLGRVFTAEEEQPGRSQVIILSHSFWVRRFAADTNIIGRNFRIDGESVTVIGVMPATFEIPQLWGPMDAWRPLAFTLEEREDRRNHWISALARMKSGVPLSKANATVKAIAARMATVYPENDAHHSLRVAPLQESIGDTASRRFAWLLLGLTGFVLVIACVNLANLQLTRTAARSREIAVRLALGARRSRLMGQLLVESVILALLGGTAGIVLANLLADFIGSHIQNPAFPEGVTVALDERVLWFTLISSIVTGVLFGVGPAWLASHTNVNDVLKANARGTTAARSQQRLRQALIVGEVALALVLLTGAGLFLGGLQRFIHRDPGWRVDGLLTGWLPLTSSKYDSADKQRGLVERLEARLTALPGVEQASISSSLPIWSFGSSRPFVIEGRTRPPVGQEPLAHAEAVTPDYFETLGIRLKQGRIFNSSDTTNRPDVVIINESMARQFWPGENPIGKRTALPFPPEPDWQEIVGIVNDIRFPANLGRPDTVWQIYRPLAQEPCPFVAVELRTTGPPENLTGALRRAVAEIDPDLPVNELRSARNWVETLLSHFAVAGVMLGLFAILGLILAALGIYSVISYFVLQRTGEIGIRMALGAQVRDVLWMVLRKGLALTLLGILLGLGGAWIMTRLLWAAVPELRAESPVIFLGIIGGLIVVTLFACWLPARRASKVEPTEALRYE